MSFEEQLTTIFLGDRVPPTRLLLLKRSASKILAPHRYTGVGGKVEPGEDHKTGALRELAEETGLNVTLHEFGRVILNKRRILYFFWRI